MTDLSVRTEPTPLDSTLGSTSICLSVLTQLWNQLTDLTPSLLVSLPAQYLDPELPLLLPVPMQTPFTHLK